MIRKLHAWAWMLSVLAAWVWTWHHLSLEWSVNEQYQFAWAVPFLAIYIGWRNWSGIFQTGRPGLLWLVATLLAAAGFATGLFLQWNDPLWRLTGGLLALGALLLTGSWFYRSGGVPMLQRQGMTLCICCFAVPWPTPLEHGVTTGLLDLVTSLTTAVLNMAGVAALRHGSLIELSNGWVGMEDACSGIHSLQAALMASVFLGELFKLGLVRRGALVGGSILLCLVFNSLRIQALVWILHSRGSISSAAHDTVGTTASLILFLGIGLLSFFMAPGTLQISGKKVSKFAMDGAEGYWLLLFFALLPLGVGLSDAFRTEEAPDSPALWNFDVSALPQDWRVEPLPPRSNERSILHYSQSRTFGIWTTTGPVAQVSQFYWESNARIPGPAFVHTPAMCMLNQGWTPSAPLKTILLSSNGKNLTGGVYFMRRDNAARLVVQILTSEDGSSLQPEAAGQGGWKDRLKTNFSSHSWRVRNEVLIVMPDTGNPDKNSAICKKLLAAFRFYNNSKKPVQ